MSEWKMQTVAEKVAERMDELSDQKLPMEILKIEDGTAAVVFDIAGVDYIATITAVPKPRERPTSN